MVDDIAPLSFVERVARLEERMTSVITLLDEIRADQKELADTVARASGGLRMLLLLGGLAGFLGALRSLVGWAGTLLPHSGGNLDVSCFDQAFSVVVGHEGGYDATRSDPGNWTGGSVGAGELRGTKFGISAAAYPALDIANLQLADAQALYLRDYWNPIAGDRLQPALALLVFDAAVNNGVARAAKWLQAVVSAVPDGLIGDQTLAAVGTYLNAHGGAQLCAEFMAQRLTFMTSLPTWPLFGLGWARRLCALPWQSLAMPEAAA